MSLLDKIRNLFDRGRKPADLARWLEVPEQDLLLWLEGRPAGSEWDYRVFTIPKRRGGTREIHAPGPLLRDLQRIICQRLLVKLPVHPAATGFVRGRSIVDNARPHAGQGVVINIDLADFFPSITSEQVQQSFQALNWNRQAASILANICTHHGRLPQGAPTSPALSNLVCRRLDARLTALMQRVSSHLSATGRGILNVEAGTGRYTRYADDLTFSFPGLGRNKRRRKKPPGVATRPRKRFPSRTLLRVIRRIIEEEGFRIQMKKRVRIQRAHQRQTVTGLVVNHRVNLPRDLRRRLRAMEHRSRTNQIRDADKPRLAGWHAFAAMVDAQRERPARSSG